MAGTWDIKNFTLAVILSYVFATVINIIINSVFPQVPVIKSGVGLIFLLIGVVLAMLFVFVQDKRVDKLEIWMFVIVLATCIGIFWAVKTYVPQLFSIIPDSTKNLFSVIG